MVEHPDEPNAADLGISEVTRRLNVALDKKRVAVLADAAASELASGWAQAGGPQPGAASAKHLRFGYEQWKMVANAEGDDLARAWFIGANRWLGNDTPVNAIRSDKWEEVTRAAHALINGSFDG